MSLTLPTRLMTAVEFLEQEFDASVELVRGEVHEMTRPGWRHGKLCLWLGSRILQWCEQKQAGFVFSNDTGILTERNPDTLRGPDLFYVSQERLAGRPLPEGVPVDLVPNLCIEVLSPSDRRGDVLTKVAEYLKAGVSEVWVVDPEYALVQLFRDDAPDRQYTVEETLVSRELPEFSLNIRDLFATNV